MTLAYTLHSITGPGGKIAPKTVAEFDDKQYDDLLALKAVREPTEDEVSLYEQMTAKKKSAAPAKKKAAEKPAGGKAPTAAEKAAATKKTKADALETKAAEDAATKAAEDAATAAAKAAEDDILG